MNNWKVIPTIVLATVLIFGAGVFTGGVLVDCVKKSHPKTVAAKHPGTLTNAVPLFTNAIPAATNAPGTKPPKPPQILSTDFLQRLDNELHLTKDQHDAVQKIITDGQNAMRKVVQDARLEIREELTPEQLPQFDELMKRPFRRPLFGTNAPATNALPAPVSPAAAPVPATH